MCQLLSNSQFFADPPLYAASGTIIGEGLVLSSVVGLPREKLLCLIR